MYERSLGAIFTYSTANSVSESRFFYNTYKWPPFKRFPFQSSTIRKVCTLSRKSSSYTCSLYTDIQDMKSVVPL